MADPDQPDATTGGTTDDADATSGRRGPVTGDEVDTAWPPPDAGDARTAPPPTDGTDDDGGPWAHDPPTPDPAPAGWPDPNADEAPSANLVAIAVDDVLLAQEALLAAMRLVRRGHLKLEDAAIVVKEEGGRIRIQETRDTRPPQGAATGSWLGMIASLFIAPGALIVGAALGAAAGGIFAKLRDIGLQDEDMKALGEQLDEGTAALLLLVEEAHLFHAMTEARRFHGRILRSTCDDHTTERLAEALADSPWAFPG